MMETNFYWSSDKVHRVGVPFNFLIGGRGTGKTYRALMEARELAMQNFTAEMLEYYGDRILDMDKKFLYLRRTEVEIASIAKPRYNPFKALNRDKKWDVTGDYVKSDCCGTFEEEGKFLGYAAALSNFGNIRGADLTDVDFLIFDEFIRQKNKKRMEGEADLFMNAYETISRNRELEDGIHQKKGPLPAWLLSNSTSLDSPLLEEWGLVTVIEKMKQKGQKAWTNYDRGIHIELIDDLPVSHAKKETALYRASQNTKYYSHAIDNEFAYDSFENIRKTSIQGYECIMKIDDIYLFQNPYSGKLHATTKIGKPEYKYSGDTIPLFRKQWGVKIYTMMRDGTITYDSFAIKSKLWQLFDSTK